MKTFQVTTSIRATPETIWRILTDAPQYTSWNTTVDRVEGRIAEGGTVTVYTKLSPGRAFPAKVTHWSPATKMIWTGGMPLGLFKGERVFTLEDRGNGTVDFQMTESFTGLLAPLIGRSIPDLQPAFSQFAADLKKRAEDAQ